MAVQFKMLYCGKVECERFRLIDCEDESRMIWSPMVATLIKHPKLGNVLLDTANSPFFPVEYGEDINKIYPITEFISIADALRDCDLTVNDIDMIILTHLHFDHAGGLHYFKGTKAIKNVWLSESELRSAFSAVLQSGDNNYISGAYVRSLFDIEGINFHTYTGELDLGDGLKLFEQHSHTEGVTGLILETAENGNWIFTSDTIYTMESFKGRIPPGGHINKSTEEFFYICDEVQKMLDEYNAQMMPGHDYDMVVDFDKRGFIR